MVKLEEVTDETFLKSQPGQGSDEEWDTDSESDASSTTSSLPETESLYDRILALQDIVPPRTRQAFSKNFRRATSVAGDSLEWTGKALWIITSSVLLVAIPFAIAFEDDRAMAEQEMQSRQAAAATEFMTPGAPLGGGSQGKPAGAGL